MKGPCINENAETKNNYGTASALNPVQRRHAQEAEAFSHGDACCFAEQESAGLLIRTQYSAVCDEVGKLGREGVEVLAEAIGTKIGKTCLLTKEENRARL